MKSCYNMSSETVSRLILTGSNCIFSRMQNLVWVASGLELNYMIEKNAGDLLAEIVNQYGDEKIVVVNFLRIKKIDDYGLKGFFEALVGNKRQVVITNGNHLYSEIENIATSGGVESRNDPTRKLIILGKQDAFEYDKITGERDALVKSITEKIIKNCFEKFGQKKRLSSTPLIANGEFNSSAIISDPKSFMWITTFLADKLDLIIDEGQLSNVRLISVSLRGTPFAAALGLLLGYPFETIDHLGPKHKIFESGFGNHFDRNSCYIFIGDFCIGGTEIKTAKTCMQFYNLNINHALVIGNYVECEHFKEYFTLNSIIDLKQLGLASYEL